MFQAIKAGFRGVDTACQPKVSLRCEYQDDPLTLSALPVRLAHQLVDAPDTRCREDLVGTGLKRAFEAGICKREEIFVQTK